MINLLISYDPEAWENGTALFERSRCLTEYILPEIRDRFSAFGESEIAQLKAIPCVFAYEQVHRRDAYVGYFTSISVRQSNIRLDFQLTSERIRFEDLAGLGCQLDMGKWEANRTHWTIKNVDIEELRPFFSTNAARKPTVFVSYSWSPPENQRAVFGLVERLTIDGIQVIYDKNSLHPGQDKGYFMEQALTNKEIDYVLVVCNQDYALKANERRGGVGYESEIIISQLVSKPLQTRIIPIAIETDRDGRAFLPITLQSRIYIDLTREEGYSKLLSIVKAETP